MYVPIEVEASPVNFVQYTVTSGPTMTSGHTITAGPQQKGDLITVYSDLLSPRVRVSIER